MNNPLLDAVITIARQAGQQIFTIYQQAAQDPALLATETKLDGSPLTLADRIANDHITSELSKLIPQWPVLSEESTDIPYVERAIWDTYWLVDPLDGTQEFLQRTNDFTVNIALIQHHQPILGVIYVPVSGITYYAERGNGAYKQLPEGTRQLIKTQPRQQDSVRIIASRRHAVEALAPILKQIPHHALLAAGSSLKFCKIAEGSADIYPRFGLTSEWDTAAGQCIVEAASGQVIDLHGLPLRYNTGDSTQNPHFLVLGERRHDDLENLFLL